MRAFFHREGRCANVSDQHAGLEDLNSFGCRDVCLDSPAADQRAGGHDALDHRVFADDQRALGMNFPIQAAVDAYRPFKVDDTFEVHTSSEECEILFVNDGVFPFPLAPPHASLL